MTAPGSGNLDVPFRGPAVTPALSPRQRAIFELLAEGLARKEVAGRLGLSFHTVRNDIEIVYAHLDTGNLVTAFHRLGWVRVDGCR